MRKIIVVIFVLILSILALKLAPNYEKINYNKEIKLIINYTNVTNRLKNDLFIDDKGVIYLSKQDISNYYDGHIYYDERYNQIITTSDNKVASLPINKTTIYINSEDKIIESGVVLKDDLYYIPISELEDVYNIKVKYNKSENVVIIDSLNFEYITSEIKEDKTVVKYKETNVSRTLDKLSKGDKVAIIKDFNNTRGWVKVRTDNGKIGHIEENKLEKQVIERKAKIETAQIEGNISLVWEYFSEYAKAPNRTGTKIKGINVVSPAFFYLLDGELYQNIGEEGLEYIEWAKQNNYKVWPMVANNSNSSDKKESFSKLINDYKSREKLINSIVNYAKKYKLDGINLDFENMYSSDKDMFSRFVIELAPRLKDIGIVFSVDVTAPDGSPDWSLCYDRNVIGKVSDYIVFMAYDQHGVSSKKPGTVAGFNWVETNIKKFIGQENVEAKKIILGIPFYTRLWKENNESLTSSVVSMRNLEKNIPEHVELQWNDECKQNYMEYEYNRIVHKMWIEDEKSIQEKLQLVENYELAGAAYWVKGFEKESIWNIIKDKLKIK